MAKKKIYMRFADQDDCKDTFLWRNDSESVRFSNKKKIVYKNHNLWFQKKIKNRNTNLFIITDDHAKKLGVVRFDKKGKNATISLNINPYFRGKGLGEIIIRNAIYNYFNNFDVNSISAYIKVDNVPSIKVFTRAGFKKVLRKKDFFYFILKKCKLKR